MGGALKTCCAAMLCFVAMGCGRSAPDPIDAPLPVELQSGMPADVIKCVETGLAKITAITAPFDGPKRKADCRPAKLPACATTSARASLAVEVSQEWKIDGALRVVPTAGPNGRAGFEGLSKTGERTADASAWCRGEGCGGAGTWAEGYITGVQRRVPTNNERRRIVGACVYGSMAKYGVNSKDKR